MKYQQLPTTFHELLNAQKNSRVRVVYLKNYWKNLLLVAAFYGLPSIQYVLLQYKDYLNGEFYCYFNFKCAHDILGLKAFNNIISNIAYIILGLVYILFVRVNARPEEEDFFDEDGEDTGVGLHTDDSLFYSLGWTLVFEGIFSALYHVCPSRIEFQFDSTFMVIGTALLFLTLYQKRHPTTVSGSYRAFAFMAALIFLNVFALLKIPSKIFWVIVVTLIVYVMATGTIHLYYGEKVRFDWALPKRLLAYITAPGMPTNKFRFLMLLIANGLTYALTIATAVNGFASTKTLDFSNLILSIMVMNTFLFLVYYIVMKYVHKERLIWPVWILFVLMVVCMVSAIYFYEKSVTNKFLSPKESEALNKPCVLFHFFDYHDIWHFLSAFGVFLQFLVVYLLDYDIKDQPRKAIPIF